MQYLWHFAVVLICVVEFLLTSRGCWYCGYQAGLFLLHCILYIQYPTLMKLMMFIGNDLIEAVPLDETRIPKPGYLGYFKRNLKEKYQELIRQFSDPPEFYIMPA